MNSNLSTIVARLADILAADQDMHQARTERWVAFVVEYDAMPNRPSVDKIHATLTAEYDTVRITSKSLSNVFTYVRGLVKAAAQHEFSTVMGMLGAFNDERIDDGDAPIWALERAYAEWGVKSRTVAPKVAPKVDEPKDESSDEPKGESGKGDLVGVILGNLAHVTDVADLDRIMLAIGQQYDRLVGKVAA